MKILVAITIVLAIWKLAEIFFWLGSTSYKLEQAIEELYQKHKERKKY